MSNRTIKDKVILIAGGAKNLGGLLARDFAAQGAKAVVIHYNSAATADQARDTLAAVQAAGAKGIAIQADLTSAAANAQLFAEAEAAFGRPDIAINTGSKQSRSSKPGHSEA